MSSIQRVNFSCSRDNLTIRGLYFRPQGQRLPVAIISHGFMANYRTTQKYAKWFADHGYVAFCFDFNGGGLRCKSDKDTTRMTIFTETEDLAAVISYAKSLPETDESAITLMGCSQGGVVSALVAARLQEQIQKLVLFYPALCIPDDARAGKMMFAQFDPENIPNTIRCGPMMLGRDYAASVLNLDMINEISRYKGRVLIVHGTADRIVDYHYSEQAQAAYADAVLKLIPEGKHGFSKKDVRLALTYVAEFLK